MNFISLGFEFQLLIFKKVNHTWNLKGSFIYLSYQSINIYTIVNSLEIVAMICHLNEII